MILDRFYCTCIYTYFLTKANVSALKIELRAPCYEYDGGKDTAAVPTYLWFPLHDIILLLCGCVGLCPAPLRDVWTSRDILRILQKQFDLTPLLLTDGGELRVRFARGAALWGGRP